MRFGKVIILLLYFAFVIGLLAGIYLTTQSLHRYEAKDPIVLEGKANADEVYIKLQTMAPGVVLIVIGGIGLILMLVKTPVREILGYQPVGSGRDMLALMTMQPILSETKKVPLLLWWLYYSRGHAIRVQ